MTPNPKPPDLLREVAERSPIGMAVVRADGTLSWSNAAFARMGAAGSSAEGNGSAAGGGDGLRGAVRRCLENGRTESVHDVRLDGGGPVRYVDLEAVPLPERGGRPTGAAVFVRDVTATFEERERARLFYTAFLTSTNAIEATDPKGVLVDVNPAFEKIYGFRRDEVLGHRPNVVRSSFTPPEVYQDLWSTISDPKRGSWSGEILNRDKEGRERPVFLTITAVRNPAGAITNYLGVAVDLSERRAWEHQAAHADKLASLGQLAAGVAHEINTPLANVMLVAESIRRRTSDDWVRSRITTVTQQVEVAARIVRGLLDFARRTEPEVTPLDLRQVARDALDFVRGNQSEAIDLALELPPTEVTVLGDRGQLLQVLTNLLLNAFDALEGKGTVRLALSAAGGHAVIEVADTGPGISPKAMPHIFEPFFTTKGEGKGTGLGLAICHGIIQAHHGAISAANRPQGGAVFRVTLPLATN